MVLANTVSGRCELPFRSTHGLEHHSLQESVSVAWMDEVRWSGVGWDAVRWSGIGWGRVWRGMGWAAWGGVGWDELGWDGMR